MYRLFIKHPYSRTVSDNVCCLHKISLSPAYRHYSDVSSNKGKTGRRIVFILGSAIVASGGAILYIRNDHSAQKWIKDYIPGSQDFLQLINKDLKFYSSFEVIDDVKKSLTNLYDTFIGSKKEDKTTLVSNQIGITVPTKSHVVSANNTAESKTSEKNANDTSKPSSTTTSKKETVTKPTVNESKDNKEKEDTVKNSPQENNAKEDRFSYTKSSDIEHENELGLEDLEENATVDDSEKPNEKEAKPSKKEKQKKEQMVTKINKCLNKIDNLEKEVATDCNNVVLALNDYQEKVIKWTDSAAVYDDDQSLKSASEKIREKELLISKVEKAVKRTLKKIDKLEKFISRKENEIDQEMYRYYKETCSKKKRSVENLMSTVDFENSDAYLTDVYHKSVMKAKEKLTNSLGIAFPEFSIEGVSDLSRYDLDLFILYAYRLINLYRKELEKHEAFKSEELNKLYEAKTHGAETKIKDLVKIELSKERRNFEENMIKNEFKLRRQFEKDRQKDVQRLIEEFDDYISRVVNMKDREIERMLQFSKDEAVEKMRMNYNRQLCKLIAKLKALEQAVLCRADVNERIQRSQFLWNACQFLKLAVKNGGQTSTVSDVYKLKPLDKEVKAIAAAAAGKDELVKTVLETIPKEVVSRGIYSELALRERFLKLERVAYHLSAVPEGRVSLVSLFWSYVQSVLIFKPLRMPNNELADEAIDTSTLSNYDIVYRARYWIDRGEYLQALRYMNLLKGAARIISLDWMNEMRIFLETQQIANTLLLYSIYSSQIH